MTETAQPQACFSKKQAAKIPGELGIWVFIAGDLLVFSVFFILIALGQTQQTELFNTSRANLDLRLGIINTLLLLTGSWLAAVGVEKCQSAQNRTAKLYFSLAILCGTGFIANKLFEWNAKISAGITPATNDFYMYFFIFTGIHLFHVLIGIGILFLVRRISQRPTLNKQDLRGLESGTLFWHLVDLLWVVLFALFYLL